ncbi:ATP-binding protein [Micromonospora sp. NPDC049301]|uniref:ATP-binding protein n=1 Tax=Micromonospora sp. NPDC049301 TaxID=3155723 RepID=UPI00343F099D
MTGFGRPDATPVTREHNGAIMSTRARCLVEIDESSPVVRLTGVLDAAGAGMVRDALLSRLCDRPGPVVADVTGLRVADQVGLGVFAEVRQEVADWPAADLLLCDPAVSGSGGAQATLAGVPAWPNLGDALAAAPLAAVLTAELAPTVGAAREARELVMTGCLHWDVRTLAETASIAITEMVNNVVAHARTPMTIRLAPQAGTLRVAVRDHSPLRPTFGGLAPSTRAGGRGLLLIDTMARRWGSSAVPDGKVVWCVLDPEDETDALA